MWIDIISNMLPIALFLFAFVAFLIRGVLSVVLTKIQSFAKVYICTFLCVFILFAIFLVVMILTPSPPGPHYASNILSVLRTMQVAAQSFYEDKQDTLSEIPRGSNIAEYLEQYIDWPVNLSNDGPFIFIISGDHWWVGRSLGQSRRDRRATHEIRRRLTARASSVWLFGSSEFAPPLSADVAYHYNMDDFVWMFVREVTEVQQHSHPQEEEF